MRSVSGSATGDDGTLRGYFHIVAVYLAWGFMPAYWRLLRSVDPFTIMAHRILWSCGMLLVFMLVTKPQGSFTAPLQRPGTAGSLVAASLSLAAQWAAYLFAVATGRLMDLSLGYYLYPLVVTGFGAIAVGERITRFRAAAFCLAAVGVGTHALRSGGIPPLSLILACSFAIYNLIKKNMEMDPVRSVFFETLLMSPFAIAGLAMRSSGDPVAASHPSPGILLLLAGGGVATVATLILFASGAKRIPVFAVGFLQYLSPTIVLLLGVFSYGERFGIDEFLLFGFIWLSLAVLSIPVKRAMARGARGSDGA